MFGGVLTSGKPAMMTKFRQGYAGIEMSFVQHRAIYSGHYAIVEGELTWRTTMQDGKVAVSNDTPFVLILRIEGGKVVEHRDYADYHPFIEAVRAL